MFFSPSAALAVAVVAAMTVPATAGRTISNINTSVEPGNQAEDAIAINPTDPQNIVTISSRSGHFRGLFKAVTFDGGKTWARQVIGKRGPLGVICCDEQLAFDRFGNLWMAYLVRSGLDTVPIALSSDGGLTLRKVAAIVPTKPTGSRSPENAAAKGPALRASGATADQPSISTGQNSVWVSYTSFPSVTIQASGASVRGLGDFGSFSPPESVPTSGGRGDYGDTAVGPDGQVMVTYQDQTNGQGGSHIYVALDPDGLGPAGFGDPRLLARSRVGGFDYIPAQRGRSVDAEANLAWDKSGGSHNGRVYAIWTQENGNESDDTDVMFQYSDDNGATWSAAVRLNDDQTPNSQFNPAIAVDQTTGLVAISSSAARADLGSGGPGDTDGVPNDDTQVWATYSRDGGATFAPNLRVSKGTSNADDTGSSFDYGDYTHASFQSHLFYPVWSDNSNSTADNPNGTLHQLDLYTASVSIP